jgi:hypothetical protein
VGTWRDAEDERTIAVDDRLFDAAEASIASEHRPGDDAPGVVAAMTPFAVELGPHVLHRPIALLLTGSSIVMARDTGFVRRTSEITTVERADIIGTDDVTAGTDSFVVAFRHATFGACTVHFGLLGEAEFLAADLARDDLATPTGTPSAAYRSLPPPPAVALSGRNG